MAVIYPAPGGGPTLARLLIALADDPHEVGVTHEGGLGFVVSDELEQRWLDAVAVPENAVPVTESAAEPVKSGKGGKNRKPVGADVELPKE